MAVPAQPCRPASSRWKLRGVRVKAHLVTFSSLGVSFLAVFFPEGAPCSASSLLISWLVHFPFHFKEEASSNGKVFGKLPHKPALPSPSGICLLQSSWLIRLVQTKSFYCGPAKPPWNRNYLKLDLISQFMELINIAPPLGYYYFWSLFQSPFDSIPLFKAASASSVSQCSRESPFRITGLCKINLSASSYTMPQLLIALRR